MNYRILELYLVLMVTQTNMNIIPKRDGVKQLKKSKTGISLT